MALTFGGATGDDVNFTLPTSLFSASCANLICGWWYPTTLTAGRYYFGVGTASAGMRVHTTTSELSLLVGSSTPTEWASSGAGITTGKWQFIAMLVSCVSSGGGSAFRLWVGDQITPPVEISVASFSGGSGAIAAITVFTVGNLGAAGTVAFPGDIGPVWGCGHQNTSAVGASNPFGITTAGTIDNSAAELVLRRFVIPGWHGAVFPQQAFRNKNWISGNTSAWQMFHCENEASNLAPTVMLQQSNTAATPLLVATKNGASATQNRPGRPGREVQNIIRMPWVRRAA